jgi:hypothetical protein
VETDAKEEWWSTREINEEVLPPLHEGDQGRGSIGVYPATQWVNPSWPKVFVDWPGR